jgi:peptide deformylase
MAILKVASLGHPVLRAVARPVAPEELASPALQRLIDDMIETMYEYEGVGLAAPQVHVGLRIAVIEVPETDERSTETVPLTVLVNPEVTPVGNGRQYGWEGCLSIPELRGTVPRHARLQVTALDRDGRPLVLEAADFFARVVQHERDHLDGLVYLDRMEGLRSLSYRHELERHAVVSESESESE